ncbi:MAG: diguanylate cyclase, partial [Anaerolineales bacterium]|nr:diguanylate cyclase [Anaerolineales bacterium]
ATDPYYFSNDEHYGLAICIPILSEKDLLGVLYVESIESDAFDYEDVTTLETLANQISASLQRALLYSRAQEHLRIMATVQAVSRVISSSLDLQTIFDSVVQELHKSFGYTHVSIYLLKDDYLHLGAQMGYPQEMIIDKIHISQGVTGRTIKTKAVQFIRDASKEPSFLRADNTVISEICVPLMKEKAVLGTLNVEGDANRTLKDEDVELLTILSGPIALAVDNARLHAQVKEMAMTDAVSGLSNRYALEKILTAELERSTRLTSPLSLIIFDVDSFKEYNDKWGHPAGDIRLKATADMIRANLRKYDVAARYGGDEFAIILPNTDETGALEFAKRLQHAARASTTETPVENKGVSGHTLSIGIASFPQDANSLANLLLAADHAELMAKRLGKNQIFLARNLNKNETT